jgi:hypothetical protein
MRFFQVLGFLVGGLVVVILTAALLLLLGAVALYVYPSFKWLLYAVAGWLAFFMAVLVFAPFMLGSDEEKTRSSAVAMLALAPAVWLFTGYLLYLAGRWNIVFEPWIATVLGAPQFAIDQVAKFFTALFQAIPGLDLSVTPPTPDEASSPPVTVANVDIGPVVYWLADSAWQLALGVAGGLLTAILLKQRRAA